MWQINENNMNKSVEVSKNSMVKIKQGISYVLVTDCAKTLGVSKSTVYQMLNDGRIEGAFRINRAWRIPVAETRVKRQELQHR